MGSCELGLPPDSAPLGVLGVLADPGHACGWERTVSRRIEYKQRMVQRNRASAGHALAGRARQPYIRLAERVRRDPPRVCTQPVQAPMAPRP